MKRIILIIIFLILIVGSLHSQIYIGLGPTFSIPDGDFSELNNESIGFSINLESRAYCKLWYGFRIDRISYLEGDNLPIGTDFVESAFNLSPNIRFNFLNSDCYDTHVFPYLQAGTTLSIIRTAENTEPFGWGAFGGAGMLIGFNFLDLCWSADFNASYNSPNWWLRDENRDVLNSINVGLIISIGI